MRQNTPKARSAHSLCAYKEKLVLFGGSGFFHQEIGMREAYNDLWMWDTGLKTSEWRQIECKGSIPIKRMHHAAGCLGGVMLVVGGFNTEAKVVLDDYNLFDF